MKPFLLVSSAVLMALGSISVSVNAQSTRASEVTANVALEESQPGKTLVPKHVNATACPNRGDVVYVAPAGRELTADEAKR